MLQTTPVFFWMDSSIRFHTSNITTILNTILEPAEGALIFERTRHPNAWVTWPKMYEYLPTNISQQLKTHSAASTMLYMNTRANYENFMHWHILCALVQDCIAPTNKLYCNFKLQPKVTCHRFDMSSLNLLLSNYHGFNSTKYILSARETLLAHRGDTGLGNLKEYNRLVKSTSVAT